MSYNSKESDMHDVVEQFQDDDVLAGGGTRTNKHKGNQYFCEFMKNKYISEHHHSKAKVYKAGIEAVKHKGRQFLHKDNGSWLVIKDEKKLRQWQEMRWAMLLVCYQLLSK